MEFELLDRYLLRGSPAKSEVVRMLLEKRSTLPEVRPYYEGLAMLGARTPDLALIALRLVLAGKVADDSSVVRLRELTERSRAGGSDAQQSRAAYLRELQ